MNRRQFVTSGAVAAAVSTSPQIAPAQPKRALMKLGATVGGGFGEGGGRGEGGRGEAPAGAPVAPPAEVGPAACEGLPTPGNADGVQWRDRCPQLPRPRTEFFGRCAINCTNNREVYSFHPAGANAVFADGSVRFLKDSLAPTTLDKLATRAGGEPVGAGEY